MRSLSGKTLLITGASRGIGKAIALRAARDGANIAIASKTTAKHPKLPGTIHSAADEIEAAGGKALAIKTDIRYEDQVANAVQRTAEHFGGLDILVNNASAIYLAGTLETPMKRYDLMAGVNGRGAFLCSQKALPELLQADNPHILSISPPLSMESRWFKDNCAYTMAKYGMSMCVLGMAAEFADRGVAVNALWPRTAIDTAAIAMLKGFVEPKNCRKPAIVADAAWAILTRDAPQCTGNFFIDEEVLREEGLTDMEAYAVDPSQDLFVDFFLD